MTYGEGEVIGANATFDEYPSGREREVCAALAAVGLIAERAQREIEIRDDMIRVAHRAGASLRSLAAVSGLNRKTVTSIVECGFRT